MSKGNLSLKTYLDSLTSASVKTELVSDHTRQQLTDKISKLTIDQLALEREKCEQALAALKFGFA